MTVPLPEPWYHESGATSYGGNLLQYTRKDMKAHAAAVSAADCAALSQNLGELLAILHGDGGHYETEHGTDKAVADALIKHYARIVKADKENEELREALRDIYVCIGQGGSAYEITQRTTPIIRAALVK
jgi:hypothetical protein